jgi:hypothetical protein
VDDQEQQLLLADDTRRLLQILQMIPRVSKVWKHSKSSSISNEPNNQAMTIQGLGN